MPKFECHASWMESDTREIAADNPYRAAATYRRQTGRHPDDVDDREVIGACEVCEVVIIDGDKHDSDLDGCRWHEEIEVCREKRKLAGLPPLPEPERAAKT